METWKNRENQPKLVLRLVGQNQCINHIFLYTAYGWLLQSTLRFKGYSLLHFTASHTVFVHVSLVTHVSTMLICLGLCRESKLWESSNKEAFSQNKSEHFFSLRIDTSSIQVFISFRFDSIRIRSFAPKVKNIL